MHKLVTTDNTAQLRLNFTAGVEQNDDTVLWLDLSQRDKFYEQQTELCEAYRLVNR